MFNEIKVGDKKEIYLVASGDLRLSANQNCWEAQQAMEKLLTKAIETQGWKVKRAHQYNEATKHGFIDSQKMGMEVFRNIPPHAPIIVAESVW
ncbi:MAG TPA: fucose isomerase, partial [Cyclobacteriaceae bacterium]|nr:fucose isomerase [Cyclobacteriaceae bacterium]